MEVKKYLQATHEVLTLSPLEASQHHADLVCVEPLIVIRCGFGGCCDRLKDHYTMVDPRKPVLRSTFVMPQTNTILDQHFATSVTHSGAVTTINGERLVPISTRSDGSKRTEKKIRTGYTPPEDIQKYRAPPLGPGLAGRRDSNAPACAHTDSWSQEKVLALAASLPIKHVSTRAPLPIGRQTTVVASDILNKISGLVNPEQRGLLAASSGFDDLNRCRGFRRTASKPRVTDAARASIVRAACRVPSNNLRIHESVSQTRKKCQVHQRMDLTDISLRRPEHHVEQILDNIGKHF
jgi:hypothetical protein